MPRVSMNKLYDCITRERAIQLGAPYYYTGRPCKNGHNARRRVSNYTCLECEKLFKDPAAARTIDPSPKHQVLSLDDPRHYDGRHPLSQYEQLLLYKQYVPPTHPCPKGHMAPLHAKNRLCTECQPSYYRIYRKKIEYWQHLHQLNNFKTKRT